MGARFAPYFPGDLELGRFIQRVAPAGEWSRAVTRAAYVPWVYGVLAVSAIAALRVASWRGSAAMVITFFAMMHAEPYIKAHIARPRPSAELLTGGTASPTMAMSSAAAPSYGMPSGWALLFGATVGLLAVLAWRHTRGVARWAYVAGSAIVLTAGLAARVSMGQHWPSDLIAGYLLAITIGLAVFEVFTSLKPSRKSAARR